MKHAIIHIHFVGIGGAGMSGIAEVLHNLGYRLGLRPERQRHRSRAAWPRWASAQVRMGHDAAHIEGADAWSPPPR